MVMGWGQGPREHVLILASRTFVSGPTSPADQASLGSSGITGV